MRTLLKFILRYIISLYPTDRIKNIKRRIYNLWIKNYIPNAAETSRIEPDCYLVGGKYIKIGQHSKIMSHAVLTAWDKYDNQIFTPQIEIGNNVIIGEYTHITSINKIIIKDGVLTGRRVTITDNSHGNTSLSELKIAPIKRPLYSKGEVIIEENVWIGDKVTILPNVHIGEGSIIAANSVVTKDVPPFTVIAGVPGKIVKTIINE